MSLSITLHVLCFAMVGMGHFPRNNIDFTHPLQVTLVTTREKSQFKPLKAEALAQVNMDGGGNTTDDRQAKTPLPSISDDQRLTLEQVTSHVAKLEEESKQMLTQLKSNYQTTQTELKPQQSDDARNGEDIRQKLLEIARLDAQINKNYEAYQKMPRRKFIGSRTQEYRFAQYIEDWRIKVERIGNMNYPEQARQQGIFGSLRMSVAINADGSVESAELNKSSGNRVLDAAALRIVRLAAPFSPLPPDITKDTDILVITRTWSFTSSDKLESE